VADAAKTASPDEPTRSWVEPQRGGQQLDLEAAELSVDRLHLRFDRRSLVSPDWSRTLKQTRRDDRDTHAKLVLVARGELTLRSVMAALRRVDEARQS
jgi:hypothetical protein